MEIIANPYRSDEVYTPEGEPRTILTGRVTESRQWIMVVFVGDPETGRFLTAYHNKNLVRGIRRETMEHTVKYPATGLKPPAIVEYYSEPHILFIWTGQKSAAGEEMSESITVHYDKDEDNEPSLAVAIHIDSAEFLLRPFADKILAKYGVWREPESEQEREGRLNTEGRFGGGGKIPDLEISASR